MNGLTLMIVVVALLAGSMGEWPTVILGLGSDGHGGNQAQHRIRTEGPILLRHADLPAQPHPIHQEVVLDGSEGAVYNFRL